MPANFTKPVTSDLRADVLSYIRDFQNAQAKLFDGETLTSPPTGAIRYSAANSRFEKWNGATWGALTLGFLATAGGTMTGTLTGAGATFTSLSVGANAVWHAGNLTPANYLARAGGTMTGTLNSLDIAPVANDVSSLGTDLLRYAAVHATSFSEGGTALSAKYALAGHSHSYLPLTGGTLTGGLTGTSGAFSSLTVGGVAVSVSSHTHAAYSLTSHTHAAYAALAGANFTGSLQRSSQHVVTSANGTAPKFTRGTAAPSGGADGDFYAQYT
jgi:hypothetical protein